MNKKVNAIIWLSMAIVCAVNGYYGDGISTIEFWSCLIIFNVWAASKDEG